MTHLDQWLDYLYQRINYERTSPPVGSFKLDRMSELLRRMGNPQDDYPIVHIAGSKGKGSTAFMISSILVASGRLTGLYTSPHLHRLEERIRLDGLPCKPDELGGLIESIAPIVDELDAEQEWERGPTFFEITTALAFQHFSNRGVDVAVIEVGLGGRLDSTNVCKPTVSVITSISLDHTQLLGSTIAEIAAEKAGIIKPGVPLICGCPPKDPANPVIEDRAVEVGATAAFLETDFNCTYQGETPADHDQLPQPEPPPVSSESGSKSSLSYKSGAGLELGNVQLPLFGSHQAKNAAVAVATIEELSRSGWNQLGEAEIRQGLANVRCPGRIEVIGRRPLVVVDAAHNVASVRALCEVMNQELRTEKRWLVFGTSGDKDIEGMLSVLLPEFDEVVLTRYLTNPRAASPPDLLKIASPLAPATTRLSTCDNPHQACQQFIDQASEQDAICIAGSFYLVAEVRESLIEQRETFAL